MSFTKTLNKIPGSLMIIPLLLGALLNTIDQQYLPPVQQLLHFIGAPAEVRQLPVLDGELPKALWEGFIQSEPYDLKGQEVVDVTAHRLLNLGSFSTALGKKGILTLIAMFLFCVGAQMDFKVGRRSLKKGLVITGSKLLAAIAVGLLIGRVTDPYMGFLGLSTMAIIAAMENGNGGMYVALTAEYGNRSDVGSISVISLNDGPFFTLLALGLIGEKFPAAAFIAVLLPMLLGFGLAQLDPAIRSFTAAGERLTIPFFAFALGSAMNLSAFFNPSVLAAGLFLAVCTMFLTGGAALLGLRLFGEKANIAGLCEASTAGNAVQTPAAVAAAMAAGAAAGIVDPEKAEIYAELIPRATAQISISTITCAVVLPFLVIAYDRFLRKKGIDSRLET